MKEDLLFDEEQFKNAKPYIVLTFLMMKHFLLTQVYPSIISFDHNAVLRSKIATMEDFLNIIWPMVYGVSEQSWEILEMSTSVLNKATIALFIDRCDQQYVHLKDNELRAQIRTANGKSMLKELIEKEEKLRPLKELIEEFKERKGLNHVDILPLDDITDLTVLDLDGKYGY